MTEDIPLDVLAPELFRKEFLQSGRRLDQRKVDERRPITFTQNCLDDCMASSLVGIGKTIVVTKIEATPQPLAPSIAISVSRSAVSSVAGPVKLDKALTATIKLLTSRILSLDQLEIKRPDPNNLFQSAVKLWAWNLDIKMTIVSDDGGLEVAAILSFQEALKGLVLPCFELDEEAKLVEIEEKKKLELLLVSGMRFGMLDGKLIYDPVYGEEKVCDGCCTIVVSQEETPKLMKMNTAGAFKLSQDIVAQMIAACCD